MLFVLAIGWQVRAEMSLVVRLMTDTDKITALQKIGKLVYSGDSLLVYDNVGVLVYGDLLENVKHVRHSDEVPQLLFETQYIASQIVVYPKLTADVLYIDNVEAVEIRLCTADGRLVQVVDVYESRVELDISGYLVGIYVLFCNKQVFSIIKN